MLLHGSKNCTVRISSSSQLLSVLKALDLASERLPDFPALSPNDLLDEEISAYAEEQAALADFQDLDIDELLAWSDAEEDLSHLTNHGMEVDSVH